jgi:LDH2 family malate/lactate/ureidoglycolate dehydrogenase
MELLDADNGLGVIVGQRAMLRAVDLAREHGVGLVGVTKSNHAGMLASHVLHATAAGMIGSFVSNAPALMAPSGGREAMISNSPFAWAVPCRPDPIVLDMACSAVARGRIRLAASLDQPIPPDWATDADGVPTTDAHRAMQGLVLPMAGYKGYGLALVNELLAAALPGAQFSVDVSRRFLAEDATTLDAWGIGHVAIAIDVSVFHDPDAFADRVAGLAGRLRASRTAPGATRVLLPGDLELETQYDRTRDGIPMTPSRVEQLRAFAREAGIEPLQLIEEVA